LVISLQIIQIILSITIIALLLLQAKGAGLGSIFGSDSGVYRTRRGLEKTLHQTTIGLAVLFFVISLITIVIQ
jgi:preprotein translocase subunit SecG